MQKVFAFIIFFSFISLTGLSLSSCSNNSETSKDTDIITLNITDSSKEALVSSIQKWHVTDKKICVLFGYDFNDEEIVTQMTQLLSENFGLVENGGLIFPLVYPKDFKHGTKSYVNDLVSVLQDDDYDFCGVVLLGAPSRTHEALAKNQDKWNEKVPYPVIALFPQDEVLGIEANCDIVIDKGQPVDSEGGLANEETESVIITEAPDVLIRTVKYMLTFDGPLLADKNVQTHVAQMLKGYNLHHYADPETGLQSINHFVLN